MRYIAQQRLEVTPPGTETTTVYKPGDVVVEFDSWSDASKRALLASHYVALDPNPVLEDGTCATCGQPVKDRPKKGKSS